MSLYRQPGSRSLRLAIGAATLGLLVGLAIGLLAGRGGGEPPSLRESLTSVRERLRPATSGLELVAIEYREAVRGGRVIAPTEYAAARADLRRARQAIEASKADLVALQPRLAARLEGQLTDLERLVARRAPSARVVALAGQAQDSLRAIFP
jgi:hypothetical protein